MRGRCSEWLHPLGDATIEPNSGDVRRFSATAFYRSAYGPPRRRRQVVRTLLKQDTPKGKDMKTRVTAVALSMLVVALAMVWAAERRDGLAARSLSWSRKGTIVLHYRF